MQKFLFVLTVIILSACSNISEKVEATYEDGTTKTLIVYNGDKPIKRTEYYPNGQTKIIGEFDNDGKRIGHWQYWYGNGNLWSECDYKEGNPHGKSIVYHENGKKQYEGSYDNNKRIGKWQFWDEKGNLIQEKDF